MYFIRPFWGGDLRKQTLQLFAFVHGFIHAFF